MYSILLIKFKAKGKKINIVWFVNGVGGIPKPFNLAWSQFIITKH